MNEHEPQCPKNDAEGNICACPRPIQNSTDVDKCEVSPTGWTCSRGRGHEGPCAAIPQSTSTGNNLPFNSGDHANRQDAAAHTKLNGDTLSAMPDDILLDNLLWAYASEGMSHYYEFRRAVEMRMGVSEDVTREVLREVCYEHGCEPGATPKDDELELCSICLKAMRLLSTNERTMAKPRVLTVAEVNRIGEKAAKSNPVNRRPKRDA